MNRIILGLLVVVVLLGMALVLLNSKLNPPLSESVPATPQSTVDRLPAIPDLLGERGVSAQAEQEGGQTASAERKLVELPRLPDPLELPGAALRAPIDRSTLDEQASPAAADGAGAAPALQAGREETDRVTGTVSAPVAEQTPAAAPEQPAGQAASAEKVGEVAGLPAPLPAAVATPAPEKEPVQAQKADEKPAAAEKPARAEKQEAARAQKADEKPAAAEKPARAEKKEAARAQKADEKPAAAEKPARAEKKEAAQAQKADEKPARAEKKEPAKKASKPKITVFSRENGATVRVNVGRTITGFKQILLANPDRMVVDITGECKDLRAPGVPNNPLVTNVRLGHYENRTRIVVDMESTPGRHRVILSEDRDRLDIRLDK